MKLPILLTTLFLLGFAPAAMAAESGHETGHEGEHGDEEREDKRGVSLTTEAMKVAQIVVGPLTWQSLKEEFSAPGEVKLNSYLSSKVTPRLTAQIVTRHARLGDVVTKDQPLLTLSSVELARAVGDLLVAENDWARVKQLGSSAVSVKRQNEARIARQQAIAITRAYGVSAAQLSQILEAGITSKPGEFQLLSPQDGIVVSDDFIIGELIEPGRVLFDVVDESVLWVESSLSPELANDVEVGAKARVQGSDGLWLPAVVTQKHHMLDKETRTIGVRMKVRNEGDRLHAGMFVDTRIQSQDRSASLAVPTAAVLKGPDGDWMVFLEEEPGYFVPQEIKVVRTINDYSVIEGLDEGAALVMQGAFFVQSELAKGGFDVHNH